MNPFNNFFPEDVVTFFTDRSIDGTLHEGQKSLTPQQKKYFHDSLGFDLENVVTIRQVHGDEIVVVKEACGAAGTRVPEADAALTNVSGVTLMVRTADCLPISVYDPKQKWIGLVHAGWRGTQKKIAAKAVRLLVKGRASPKDLRVAFGPCIRRCCYTVGPDFQEMFPAETKREGSKWTFDLALANKNQLLSEGVSPENIFDCALCTCCDKRFFSYRRQGEKAGRHIALMLLKPGAGK